jgi:hypothetical protein
MIASVSSAGSDSRAPAALLQHDPQPRPAVRVASPAGKPPATSMTWKPSLRSASSRRAPPPRRAPALRSPSRNRW